MVPFTIFSNRLLTAAFQASDPFSMVGHNIAFDFRIIVANLVTAPGTPASVEWYPEFTWMDPNDPASEWFRETAEEDTGNGIVRMPKSVRHFSENGAPEAPLAEGTHRLDAQFDRAHYFCRLQMRVTAVSADNTRVTAWCAIGGRPLSAP